MNLAKQYHRDWVPIDLKGCVLYLPAWRYGANTQKWWDQSGQGNHGVISGAVPYNGSQDGSWAETVKISTGSTFNRGDFTALNAFFWSSLDLSPYARTDLGSTPYYIEVLDGAGKKATGYIGAIGAGETLDNELLDDIGFDDTSKWTKQGTWTVNVTPSKAVGGVASVYQLKGGLTVGKLYKTTVICDSIVTGSYKIWSGGIYKSASFSDVATHNSYFTILETSTNLYGIFSVDDLLNGTFTSCNSLQVTDPPSTAVHIVSTLNGTVRNWTSIESGFDPNTITSWKINSVLPRTCIGWYFDDTDDLVAHPSINFGTTHTLLYWLRSFANAKDVIHGGAVNYHVAIDGTNIYYNAGATELSQAHGGGIANSTMIGIVRSGTTVQFFKNGVQVGTDQTLDANNDQTLTTLGSYDTPGTFLGGVILENEGFTRAFSASEMKSAHDNTRKLYGI